MLQLANAIAALATGNAGHLIRRARRKALVYSLVAVLAFSAYLAGLVGLGFYLAPIFGPASAAFLIALGVLTLAVAVVAISLIVNRLEKRHSNQGVKLATSAAVSLLPYFIRSGSPLALVVAGGVGYLAAQALGGDKDEG